MKKLSIDEKAKLYDEAIKRVENIMTGKCKTTFMFTAGLFEHIFPELKESEDERIREKLIEFFAGYTTDEEWWGSVTEKDILAWLEKKGEQKPAEWSEEDEEMIDSIIGNIKYLYSIGSCDNATVDKKVNWLKSLSPHNTWKPNNEHYELEEFAKIVRGNLTGICKAVQKLFEAKYLQLTGNKMYGGFKD